MPTDVVVAYHAREQFDRLSRQDRASLRRVLDGPADPGTTKQTDASDRFVSRFGRHEGPLEKGGRRQGRCPKRRVRLTSIGMDLDKIEFNAAQAHADLGSFKAWIAARPQFPETEVVKEIAARRQMACLLGYTISHARAGPHQIRVWGQGLVPC